MKYVIATAGHVDHGKSTLVDALTGINPDRLIEEQERQMTIDLGFAWLDLPNGDEVGIVDVPGHRDFITNMLSGVGGIDAVLLLVAADEGVMPQTVEHIQILDLLQVNHGIVVITKIDLVQDEEWLQLVEEDIHKVIQTTTLKDFPFLRVSAKTRKGLPKLVKALQNLLPGNDREKNNATPRLPIDRVFSIKGFGTVVTGTLLEGVLELGDEVEIIPAGKKARIRGIETHKQKREKAEPGSRAALNLSGVDVDEIKRGDVVVHPNTFKATGRIDAEIRVLRNVLHPLKHNDSVKFFMGTAEVMARVRTLGMDAIEGDIDGFVQLELDEPVVCSKGDRFIIRRPSPAETIGGGEVINPFPTRRYKRFSDEVMQALTVQSTGSVEDVMSWLFDEGYVLEEKRLQDALSEQGFQGEVEIGERINKGALLELNVPIGKKGTNKYITLPAQLRVLEKTLTDLIQASYDKSSLFPGISIADAAKSVDLDMNVLVHLLREGYLGEDLNLKRDHVCLTSCVITFSEKDERKLEELNRTFDKAPYAPPTQQEVEEITGKELYQALVFRGDIVPTMNSIVFRKQEFDHMKHWVVSYIKENDGITLSQFRDQFMTSRKYALAFLEYLDAHSITQRVGDVRKMA